MTPEQGKTVLEILKNRDGVLTVVELTNGRFLEVMNIVWGLDTGADFNHITTNFSPHEGKGVDLFFTSDVHCIRDEKGNILFQMA